MKPEREYGEPGTVAAEVNGGDERRLELLYNVGRKIGSLSSLAQLVEHIVKTTQKTLRAAGASVLLLDEKDGELCFDVAEGEVGKALKRTTIGTESGIAGWVVRHGKPLLVNDVSQDRRFNRHVDEATGFVTRSILCVPLLVHRKTIGVIEVLNKQEGAEFDMLDQEILESVASTAAIAIENTRLQQSILDGYKTTIGALAAAIDAKDPYTCGHSRRVQEYVLLAGSALPLSGRELESLEWAALLHDIGKIGIADRILSKPSGLTDGEYRTIRQHPAIGAGIIKDVPFLTEARELVLHHHEKYDGSGYPGRLKGDAIPLGARLLAVADAFDTMTTDRAYRPALSAEFALDELGRCAGSQFCPAAVRAFISGFNARSQRRHQWQ